MDISIKKQEPYKKLINRFYVQIVRGEDKIFVSKLLFCIYLDNFVLSNTGGAHSNVRMLSSKQSGQI